MCIPDEPLINVTGNKNQPSSYRLTQVNQRNLGQFLTAHKVARLTQPLELKFSVSLIYLNCTKTKAVPFIYT